MTEIETAACAARPPPNAVLNRNGTEDRPNTSTEQDEARVLAARIRVACARGRLRIAEMEEIGACLSAGRITSRGALHWLWQIDATELVLGREAAP